MRDHSPIPGDVTQEQHQREKIVHCPEIDPQQAATCDASERESQVQTQEQLRLCHGYAFIIANSQGWCINLYKTVTCQSQRTKHLSTLNVAAEQHDEA